MGIGDLPPAVRTEIKDHVAADARIKLFNSILPAKQRSPRCKIDDAISFIEGQVKRFGILIAIFSLADNQAKMLLQPLPFKNPRQPRCPYLGRPVVTGYNALPHYPPVPAELHPVTALRKRVRLVPLFTTPRNTWRVHLVAGKIKESVYFSYQEKSPPDPEKPPRSYSLWE
jgi:hypothetical protein